MSTLYITDALGYGFDMSGTANGIGFAFAAPSVSFSYLGALDQYTLAFSVSGLNPTQYMTVSGSVDLTTGYVLFTDLYLFDRNVSVLLGWSNANILANIYDDFSSGVVFSILNDSDVVFGNSYSDTIKSGNSSDTIFGNGGNDVLFGENGNDFVYGNTGIDMIYGGNGDDVLYGGQNAGAMTAGVGTASDGILRQRDGVEYLFGEAGNDVIYGNYGFDYIDGGSGNDALFGGQDSDTLVGGSGNDTLDGNRGDDVMLGGSGADIFVLGGTGANQVLDFVGVEGDRIDAANPSLVAIGSSVAGYAIIYGNGVSIELVGVTVGSFDSTWVI
jgi:Ca2+-binding RTX toxin-like protein